MRLYKRAISRNVARKKDDKNSRTKCSSKFFIPMTRECIKQSIKIKTAMLKRDSFSLKLF